MFFIRVTFSSHVGTFLLVLQVNDIYVCRRHKKHFNDFLLNMFKWPLPVFFYFGLPVACAVLLFTIWHLPSARFFPWPVGLQSGLLTDWYIRGLITFRYFQGSVTVFALHYVAEKFITFLWWRGGEATLRIVLHNNLLHFREEVEQELLSYSLITTHFSQRSLPPLKIGPHSFHSFPLFEFCIWTVFHHQSAT